MKRILVTGGTGLVGKHLQEIMPQATYISSKDFDLTVENDAYFAMCIDSMIPDTVVHLAATVGGIQAHIDNPVKFYEDNIKINTNVVTAARDLGVKNLIAMLSTCIYPDEIDPYDKGVDYPFEEHMLEDGPPAESNYGYGIAKRAMYSHIKLCREKLGLNYSCLIPCNLYGKYDNFDLETCHYVPALLKRIIQAKHHNCSSIRLWGTGEPLRQFMYAGDLAKFIKISVSHEICQDLNVATPEIKSIKEIAEIALKACDAEHLKIEFDISKPDGQFRKDVTARDLENVFPSMKYILLEYGIREVYNHLMTNE